MAVAVAGHRQRVYREYLITGPTKIIDSSSICCVVQPLSSPRTPGDNLMNQCSPARHPTRATGGLTRVPS